MQYALTTNGKNTRLWSSCAPLVNDEMEVFAMPAPIARVFPRSRRTAVRLVKASGDTAARSLQQIARDYFLLGQNAAGRWVLRDNKCRKGGIFLSQKAAMQYARRESAAQQFVIVYLPAGLEFELG